MPSQPPDRPPGLAPAFAGVTEERVPDAADAVPDPVIVVPDPVVVVPVALTPSPLKIAGPRSAVLVPTTTFVPAVPRLIGVPDTVIALPGVSVWPATMTLPCAFVEKTCNELAGRGTVRVLPPMTRLGAPPEGPGVGPNDSTVPETVMGGPPGMRV